MSSVVEIIQAISALLWTAVAAAFLLMFRAPLGQAIARLESFEGFGVKVGLRAFDDAVRARPSASGTAGAAAVAERIRRERKRLDGAEILWVDDRPTGNRLEARALQDLGARVTWAVSTAEARAALNDVALGFPPFDLIISDIDRGHGDDGLTMLHDLRSSGVVVPVIFYTGTVTGGTPPGAAGIADRPDALMALVLDVLGYRAQ